MSAELPALSGDDLASAAARSLFLGSDGRYSERKIPGGALFLAEGVPLAPTEQACVCIGAFDGLHLGHRSLVRSTIEDARMRGCRSVVVSFDPLPAEFLGRAHAPGRLLSSQDRVRALESLSPDAIVLFDFDRGLASLGYEQFLLELLPRIVHPSSVHVGSNFRLGRMGLGDVRALAKLGALHGVDVIGHELVRMEGAPISSTRVREALSDGGVELAARLLGRLHFVRGEVIHGRGEGRGLGFPTANLSVARCACLPRKGVYAGLLHEGGRVWPAAVNVGAPPTFSAPQAAFLEANLLGFEGDLYGRKVDLLFTDWLRPSRPFSSKEELEAVVLGNIDWVKGNLGSGMLEVGR